MNALGRGVAIPACFAVSLSQANERQSNPSNTLGSLENGKDLLRLRF